MNVEVFSQAKNPDNPGANEDRYLVLPDRAYAVIDGVTDKTGRRYGGLTGGQIAGRIIEQAIRDACAERAPDMIETEWLLRRIKLLFADAYARFGLLDASGTFPATPFAANVVLALVGTERVKFLIIGDCGLRLNGTETFLAHFPIDSIGAAIRKAVWRQVIEKEGDRETADRTARSYTIAGLRAVLPETDRWVGPEDLTRIREEALSDVSAALPGVPPALLKDALEEGIADQHRYANRIHPLGFPIVNGLPIPCSMKVSFDRKISEIETIELFSDGYFGCPEGTIITDWEAWYAHVEAVDPARVAGFASTKGSVGRRLADDRTILIVHNKRNRCVS